MIRTNLFIVKAFFLSAVIYEGALILLSKKCFISSLIIYLLTSGDIILTYIGIKQSEIGHNYEAALLPGFLIQKFGPEGGFLLLATFALVLVGTLAKCWKWKLAKIGASFVIFIKVTIIFGHLIGFYLLGII